MTSGVYVILYRKELTPTPYSRYIQWNVYVNPVHAITWLLCIDMSQRWQGALTMHTCVYTSALHRWCMLFFDTRCLSYIFFTSFLHWVVLFRVNNVNSLRLKQHELHFADSIFKCIYLTENVYISIGMSLKVVLRDLINNKPPLI